MQSIFKTDKMRGKYFFPFYCNSNIRSPGIQNIHTTVIHLHHIEEKQNEKKKKKQGSYKVQCCSEVTRPFTMLPSTPSHTHTFSKFKGNIFFLFFIRKVDIQTALIIYSLHYLYMYYITENLTRRTHKVQYKERSDITHDKVGNKVQEQLHL